MAKWVTKHHTVRASTLEGLAKMMDEKTIKHFIVASNVFFLGNSLSGQEWQAIMFEKARVEEK